MLQPSVLQPHLSPNLTRLSMIALTLLAFAWRMDRLAHQSLWRDEVDAIWFATRHLPDTLAMFIQSAQNGPLYFLGLRPWFALVGSSELALRLPSAFAGALCVPVLWQLARQLLPQRTVHDAQGLPVAQTSTWAAPLAALFFAVNPYQLWYAQEGKMYALITLLALLANWCWWQGITRGGVRPWLAYWLVITTGMYCHLLFILIFPLHFVWFWLAWPQSRRHWRGYWGALAALTLPYLPMLVWQWPLLMSAQPKTLFRFTPLAEVARTLIMNHAQGFVPGFSILWLGPIFFLALAGIALGWGEIGAGRPHATQTDKSPADEMGIAKSTPAGVLAPWRRYGLLLAWVLVPVAVIYGLSLRQPVFTDRYVLWIGPALLMFMALGAVVVRTHAVKLAQTLSAGFVIYVLAFWLYGGWQQKSLPLKFDLRGAIHYVAEQRAPGELLILQIPHQEWVYRYYTSEQDARPFAQSDARLQPWADGLWTNHGWEDDVAWGDAQARMAQMTAGHATVWLLRSEPEMWDSRRLLDRWLDENGQVLESREFVGVHAQRVRLGD